MTTTASNISPISKPSRNLRALDSDDKRIGLKSTELIRLLDSQKTSNKLSLPDLFFGDEGAFEIAKFLGENKNFASVELRGNNISAIGFESICEALKGSTTLKKISAEWNNIGSENLGVIALNELIQSCTTISSVDLRNNHIGPQCAGAISNIIRETTSLKTLDLRWNELGDEGARLVLLAIQDHPNKVQIDLSGNKISQEVLYELDTILHNASTAQSQKVETSFSVKKDSYRPAAFTERSSHQTPQRGSVFNKENLRTENYVEEQSQSQYPVKERLTSITDRSILKPLMNQINVSPIGRNRIQTQTASPISKSPLYKKNYSISTTNRSQIIAPSVVQTRAPITAAPGKYNPEKDIKEIEARYSHEMKEVEEKCQAHIQAHLGMAKVINDLERALDEEKLRGDAAEAKLEEVARELETEAQRRQEAEGNCTQLVAELHTRDQHVHELSVQAEQLGRENEEMRNILENLKHDNIAITEEFNSKIHISEDRYQRDVTELTAHNDALRQELERMQEEFNHQIHALHTEKENIIRAYDEKLTNATLATTELAEELKKQQKNIENMQVEFAEELARALEQGRHEEFQKAQQAVGDMDKELQGLQGEYEKVYRQNKELVAEIENMERQRKQQQIQIEGDFGRLGDENARLKEEKNRLEHDLRVLSSSVEQFKDEVMLKGNALMRLEGENESLKTDIRRVKESSSEQIERLKREFDAERRKGENNEREMKKKLTDVERDLFDTKEELQRVTAEYEKLGDMLKGNITKLISQTFNDYEKLKTPMKPSSSNNNNDL